MSKLCIDTNIYSALKRGNREVLEILENVDEIYIPAVVIGELIAGFRIGDKTKKNTDELMRFIDLPGVFIVNIDFLIAERYGILIKILRENGTPIPTNDVWIAATAFEKGSKLLTLDKHFNNIPGMITVEI